MDQSFKLLGNEWHFGLNFKKRSKRALRLIAQLIEREIPMRFIIIIVVVFAQYLPFIFKSHSNKKDKNQSFDEGNKKKLCCEEKKHKNVKKKIFYFHLECTKTNTTTRNHAS